MGKKAVVYAPQHEQHLSYLQQYQGLPLMLARIMCTSTGATSYGKHKQKAIERGACLCTLALGHLDHQLILLPV